MSSAKVDEAFDALREVMGSTGYRLAVSLVDAIAEHYLEAMGEEKPDQLVVAQARYRAMKRLKDSLEDRDRSIRPVL